MRASSWKNSRSRLPLCVSAISLSVCGAPFKGLCGGRVFLRIAGPCLLSREAQPSHDAAHRGGMQRLAEARLADPHQVVERIGRDAIRLGIGAGDDDASDLLGSTCSSSARAWQAARSMPQSALAIASMRRAMRASPSALASFRSTTAVRSLRISSPAIPTSIEARGRGNHDPTAKGIPRESNLWISGMRGIPRVMPANVQVSSSAVRSSVMRSARLLLVAPLAPFGAATLNAQPQQHGPIGLTSFSISGRAWRRTRPRSALPCWPTRQRRS